MRRLFSFILAHIVFLLCINTSVMAENIFFSSVTVHFTVESVPSQEDGNVTVSLYDGDDSSLLDALSYPLKNGISYFEMNFTVPNYSIGKKFTLSLTGGAESITFNGNTGSTHILETYSYPNDENGLNYQTDFYMQLNPAWNKKAEIHVEGTEKTLFFHCFMDEELYVTTDLLSALGINSKLNLDCEHPNMLLYSDDSVYTYTFYLGNVYALRGNEAYNLNHAPFMIDNFFYVPLYDVAVYFACSYNEISDSDYLRVIELKPSAYVKTTNELPDFIFNSSSKTDYLIWVSKSDYTVNVYMGSRRSWSLINSFPCAIGAPSTPTVEGTFEYYQYQPRWSYDKFYCGPIMRFHNGYAIHSTLIAYDGSFYDNRVGAKISHGCVRVKPENIKWLTYYIPLHTKIIVTA